MNRLADKKLHKAPYDGVNNRKKTKCRIKMDSLVQSIPIWINNKLLGYRYIYH